MIGLHVLLWLTSLFFPIPQGVIFGGTSGGGSRTWTHVQDGTMGACSASTNSCAQTFTAFGAGHLIHAHGFTGDSTSVTLTSATVGSESMTVDASCIANNGAGTTFDAYLLSNTGGETTVTLNWSTSAPGANTGGWVEEISYTGGAISHDTSNATAYGSASTTFAAPALSSFTGTNDAVFQAMAPFSGYPTSIDTSYTLLTSGVGGAFGTAYKLGVTSYVAPTWTNNSSSAAAITCATAFK